MKDIFLLKQLAQAVVDSHTFFSNGVKFCEHCKASLTIRQPHKPHCIVLVAEQILKGSEDE